MKFDIDFLSFVDREDIECEFCVVGVCGIVLFMRIVGWFFRFVIFMGLIVLLWLVVVFFFIELFIGCMGFCVFDVSIFFIVFFFWKFRDGVVRVVDLESIDFGGYISIVGVGNWNGVGFLEIIFLDDLFVGVF